MTLADRIREKAEACGYWSLHSNWAKRSERKEIARTLGCATRAVTDALKRRPVLGRPRNPELTRCELCGQPVPSAPRAAAAESTAPTP